MDGVRGCAGRGATVWGGGDGRGEPCSLSGVFAGMVGYLRWPCYYKDSSEQLFEAFADVKGRCYQTWRFQGE